MKTATRNSRTNGRAQATPKIISTAQLVCVCASEDGFPEVVFVAENAHDARMFARGLSAARYIQNAESSRVFTADELDPEELNGGT